MPADSMATFVSSLLAVPHIGAMQLHIHVLSKAPDQAAFNHSALGQWNYTWIALTGNVGKVSKHHPSSCLSRLPCASLYY